MLIAAVPILALCALELARFALERWRRTPWQSRRPVRELAVVARARPEYRDQVARAAPDADPRHKRCATSPTPPPATASSTRSPITSCAPQRRLDRTRLLVRAGPAVGLMGTLIPLAPGLAALSDGEIGTLADDLRVAFAATVVGLLVGTTAFALTLARTRTYTEDLAALERATAVTQP